MWIHRTQAYQLQFLDSFLYVDQRLSLGDQVSSGCLSVIVSGAVCFLLCFHAEPAFLLFPRLLWFAASSHDLGQQPVGSQKINE